MAPRHPRPRPARESPGSERRRALPARAEGHGRRAGASRLAALVLVSALLLPALVSAPALACPEPSDELLFHSCWGEARADLLLLPEDGPLPAPPEAGLRLLVTGAYTAREPRGEGHSAPVGFYMRGGEVVTRNMSRMDGLLIVDPESGALALHDRAAVPLGGRVFNLRQVEPRRRFAERAAEAGLDAMQSHLLIIEGAVDVAERPDAPQFRRRIVFTDAHGFGVFQTADPVTLFEAATRLDAALAPEMALNLDMGSYDLCLLARQGVERRCGVLGRDQSDRLSNLLMLTLR